MAVVRVVPNQQCRQPAVSAEFWTSMFGMHVAMDLGWVVTVVARDRPDQQVSLVAGDETASVIPDLTVEVTDIAAACARAQEQGRSIVHPLTDEPWGVRRFFVEDPDGRVINVMTHASA